MLVCLCLNFFSVIRTKVTEPVFLFSCGWSFCETILTPCSCVCSCINQSLLVFLASHTRVAGAYEKDWCLQFALHHKKVNMNMYVVQTQQFMVVIGTFALFWKQTLKPSLFFHTFSHKFELLDKVETGHCTHWNRWKVSFSFRVCLIFLFTFFFFA